MRPHPDPQEPVSLVHPQWNRLDHVLQSRRAQRRSPRQQPGKSVTV